METTLGSHYDARVVMFVFSTALFTLTGSAQDYYVPGADSPSAWSPGRQAIEWYGAVGTGKILGAVQKRMNSIEARIGLPKTALQIGGLNIGSVDRQLAEIEETLITIANRTGMAAPGIVAPHILERISRIHEEPHILERISKIHEVLGEYEKISSIHYDGESSGLADLKRVGGGVTLDTLPTHYDIIIACYPTTLLANSLMVFMTKIVDDSHSLDEWYRLIDIYRHREVSRYAYSRVYEIVSEIDHLQPYQMFVQRCPASVESEYVHLRMQFLIFEFATITRNEKLLLELIDQYPSTALLERIKIEYAKIRFDAIQKAAGLPVGWTPRPADGMSSTQKEIHAYILSRAKGVKETELSNKDDILRERLSGGLVNYSKQYSTAIEARKPSLSAILNAEQDLSMVMLGNDPAVLNAVEHATATLQREETGKAIEDIRNEIRLQHELDRKNLRQCVGEARVAIVEHLEIIEGQLLDVNNSLDDIKHELQEVRNDLQAIRVEVAGLRRDVRNRLDQIHRAIHDGFRAQLNATQNVVNAIRDFHEDFNTAASEMISLQALSIQVTETGFNNVSGALVDGFGVLSTDIREMSQKLAEQQSTRTKGGGLLSTIGSLAGTAWGGPLGGLVGGAIGGNMDALLSGGDASLNEAFNTALSQPANLNLVSMLEGTVGAEFKASALALINPEAAGGLWRGCKLDLDPFITEISQLPGNPSSGMDVLKHVLDVVGPTIGVPGNWDLPDDLGSNCFIDIIREAVELGEVNETSAMERIRAIAEIIGKEKGDSVDVNMIEEALRIGEAIRFGARHIGN